MKNCGKLIILMSVFSLFLCCKNDVIPSSQTYPKLRIENINCAYSLRSVRMLGYSFAPLEINTNQSQTFELNNGMQGGYDNIPVYISDGVHQAISKKCNFENGKTTVIKVKMTPSYVMYLE